MSPPPDPKAGRAFVWLVSCFLFLSIFVGGGFLVLYMTLPETKSTSWFPVAGMILVCFPWIFWLLTFLYRIFTRVCGGVRVHGAGGAGGAGGGRGGAGGGGAKTTGDIDTPSEAVINADSDQDVSKGGDERGVHFGAAVVLGEQNGHGNPEGKDENQSRSSSNSNNEDSCASHESEMPLALSMAS